MTVRVVWAAIALLLLITRFCHVDLVWIEEAYPAAAAAQVLRGKMLYSGIWFDKPPLSSLIYTLWGAQPGWPLRVAGTLYVLLACWSVWRFAKDLWGEREALWAASLLAFFLTFGIPSAVMALAPDLLMIVPHVLAVWLAWKRKPFAAGLTSGIALLVSSKGMFVLATCLLWTQTPAAPHKATRQHPIWRSFAQLLAGFALIQLFSAAILPREYWEQVWAWGFLYSANTFLSDPVSEAISRSSNWIGFHAVLVVGATVFLWRERNWRFAAWLILSIAAVCAGLRFFPRYYFHLLPVTVLAGARGMALLPSRARVLVLALLLIPVIRFGPRYVTLAAGDRNWSDLSLMEDSREAAALVRGGSLLVWGYRPDVFVFSRSAAGTPFLDSQPLTGVLADRHLVDSEPTAPEIARNNRQKLTQYRPGYIVDGLGPLNSNLAITRFSDLQEWLAQYEVIGRTRASTVYRLRSFGQER